MMQNPRIFLWIALALVLWLNYEAWLRDYSPAPGTGATAAQVNKSAVTKERDLSTAIPQAATSGGQASKTASTAPAATAAVADSSAGLIHVRTDVLDIDISLQGGTFQRADLLQYPKVKGGSEPIRLMNDNPDSLYLLQTGLTGISPAERPTHLTIYASPQTDYRLGSASQLRVPLTWSNGNGVTVTKTYVFKPNSYRIALEYLIENHSSASWDGAPYAQLVRIDPVTKRSMFTTNVENFSFHGPAIWDGTKYRKLKISDQDDQHLSIPVKDGWIAALQHHFVTAVVPPKQDEYRFTLGVQGQQFQLAAAGPTQTVASGGIGKLEQTLFVGPKLQSELEQTGTELDRVADYGRLTLLSRPLFSLLSWVHKVFNNWGWAIVFVTFLLKLLFYPLSEASGKSMAKMKLLAPRIKNLQESHKDDREKLGRAMMELYQREKVNPVAGCLPMIIQIPVFLAFYWVLLESVEMRQAPFLGWINDLSSRDPFFILPAIMAGAMFLQYKLNPTPPDPIQAKVFMIMPLVMSVMFAFFPAGLVLYWVTNTVLSIAQQWNINRRIEAGKKN
jgi:YidC/Oxa1 family membrane protein insertase